MDMSGNVCGKRCDKIQQHNAYLFSHKLLELVYIQALTVLNLINTDAPQNTVALCWVQTPYQTDFRTKYLT